MKNFFLSLSFLAFLSCSKTEGFAQKEVNADLVNIISEDKAVSLEEPVNYQAPPENLKKSEQSSSQKIDTISKKLIKNGDMSVQVGNIKTAKGLVNDIQKKNNAYTQSENYRNTDTSENVDITIRVPHKNFDQLINSFSDGIGEVVQKNISVDDVTEEYTDVSIKLANKKIYLEKYRDLLKKSGSTKDMLEIQEKIRGLEDEIDVAEGRLRFIDDRVHYSTLNLTLFKEKVRSTVTSKIGFGSRFADSLAEGWNGFVNFFLGIITLWPFIFLIPLVIYLLRKWKNRKKTRD